MNDRSYERIASAVLAVFLLSSCSTGQASLGTETLAETKSPVQLLRNAAAQRVDEAVVAEVRPGADGSVACLDENENPGGLVRQWISSVELALVEGSDLTAISNQLIESFVTDGWERRDPSSGESFALTILSTDDSVAQVQIEASAESEGGLVRITSTGPCVTTAGPDSDEVRTLEDSR